MNRALVTCYVAVTLFIGNTLAPAAPVWISAFNNTSQLANGLIDHRISPEILSLPILGLRFYRAAENDTYVELAPYLGLGSTLQDHFNQPWIPTGFETDNYKFLSVDTGSRTTTIYIADDDDITNPANEPPNIRQTEYPGTPAGIVTSGYTTDVFWLDHGHATYEGPPYGSIVFRMDILTEPPAPSVNCSAPLTLECTNGPATAVLQTEVRDISGTTVRVLWMVDGIPIQADSIPASDDTHSNLTMVANFGSGRHVVEIIASNGGTNVATCATTVSVLDTTPPELVCPTNLTVVMTGAAGARVSFPVHATDLCAGNAGVVCTPPSGSVFPIGTTTVTCIATDTAGNSNTCGFSVTVLGPLSIKLAVLYEMETAESAMGGESLRALHQAIIRLRRAAAAELWVNETHLSESGGRDVFANEVATVRQLQSLLRSPGNPIPGVMVQSWIGRLIAVDRSLADLQISHAVASGAEPKQLSPATRRLICGDLAANRQRAPQAILFYCQSWRVAVRKTY